MSLFILPVTSSDIAALQQGILFTTTNATDINNHVSAINAPNATETVASYANQLLAGVENTSQMAMGVTALMTGNNQPVATLTNLVNNPAIIPAYVSFAVAQNLNVGLVVGENLGLAFSGDPNFDATYGGLSLSAFAAAAASVTGINQVALTSPASFFISFYTANGLPGIPNPTAAQIQDAAYGVAFGLGVALAIEGIGSQATTIQGQVRNALFDIAQTSESPPGKMYVPGGPLASHPVPTPFQSGGGPNNLSIVDIIPRQDSFETDQNSEPSIAVNPTNPMQMIVSAFGGVNPPFFDSMNGGATWFSFGNLNHGDTSLAWKPDGSAVLATTLMGVGADPDVGSVINTFSSTVANGNFGFPINTFPPIGATKGLDQPWIETGPSNHVYIGYNNTSSATPGETASILVSSDGGNNYNSFTLDRAPSALGDDPSVREAVNGNTVYAVFDRLTKVIQNDADGMRFDSQLVVVKSANAGADGFTALGANGNGVQVATPIVPFAGPAVGMPDAKVNTPLTFGDNRSDIGTAIAVDPNNPNHVVVAFSTAPVAGVIQVVVEESTNGGMDWAQKFITSNTTRSGDSSVAILANGAIGLLYDNYNPSTNKLSQHLVTTTNDFATTPTDTTLATETNGIPAAGVQPYLGDYINLIGLGNTFYGVFSASNADNGTDAITNVTFQRSFIGTPGTANFQLTDANGNIVPPSIDPFFFKVTPAVNLVGVAPPLDHATI